MELGAALTCFPIPSALAHKGRMGKPPLGKTPPPSWPGHHLPFALSTVQWRGKLEAGHAEQLPKHVGALRWAVEPQEACQTEGRGRLKLGQGLATGEPLLTDWQQATHPQGSEQASPTCAIAVEEGFVGAIEQLELGLLRPNLLLALIQVVEAAAGPAGIWVWGAWW